MTTILFQGDSITDCGRTRTDEKPNGVQGMGCGYAALTSARLLGKYPEKGLKIYNRGISGNRVIDLYARWKADGVNLAPDLISILIGINDTWHEFNTNNGVNLKRYEEVYRMLLEDTKERRPGARLVLCEPFALVVPPVLQEWIPDVKGRQEIVARLAKDFAATHVPFQAMFDEACNEAPAEYWLYDGVHPTPAGHSRMSDFWLRLTGL